MMNRLCGRIHCRPGLRAHVHCAVQVLSMACFAFMRLGLRFRAHPGNLYRVDWRTFLKETPKLTKKGHDLGGISFAHQERCPVMGMSPLPRGAPRRAWVPCRRTGSGRSGGGQHRPKRRFPVKNALVGDGANAV